MKTYLKLILIVYGLIAVNNLNAIGTLVMLNLGKSSYCAGDSFINRFLHSGLTGNSNLIIQLSEPDGTWERPINLNQRANNSLNVATDTMIANFPDTITGSYSYRLRLYYKNGNDSTISNELSNFTVKGIPNINTLSTPAVHHICNNTQYKITLSAGSNTVEWRLLSKGQLVLTSSANTGQGNIDKNYLNNQNNKKDKAVYSIRLKSAGSCYSVDSILTEVNVFPRPVLNAVNDMTLCHNEFRQFNIAPSYKTVSTTVAWTSTTDFGTGSTSGSVSGPYNFSFTAKNTGLTPLLSTVTLTPRIDTSSLQCLGTPEVFVITVNPKVVITPVGNQTVCNNTPTTAVNFATSFTGGVITYTWTNSNTTIGLAANGTGNIGSFTAVNTGKSPVTSTISVTPNFSLNSVLCPADVVNFTITVNPTAAVDQPDTQMKCKGVQSTAINFTSAGYSGGTTTYAWTNNNTSIGLAAAGTGNIAPFTLVNAGNTDKLATLTVTPTFTFNGVSCSGPSKTFTIRIKPSPDVNTITDKILCNKDTGTAISFSGSIIGSSFSWSLSAGGEIGFGNNGNGNIGTYIAKNNGNSAITRTVTVTPSASSCPGVAGTFTVTVHPTPTLNVPSNISICSHDSINLTFNHSAPGLIRWSVTNISNGISNSSSETFAKFRQKLINPNLSTTGSVTYSITPISDKGCVGVASNLTVQVNPAPVPPVILTPLISGNTLCQFTNNMNFEVDSVNGYSYKWEVVGNGASIIGPVNTEKCIISFNNVGTARVRIITKAISTACVDTTFKDYTIKSSSNDLCTKIVLKPNYKGLLALKTNVGGYRWGYDELPSYKLGEDSLGFNQDYNVDTNLFSSRAYWVIVYDNAKQCYSKSYYGENCSTLDIQDQTLISKIGFYPNPTSSEGVIRLPGTVTEPVMLQITGLNGQVLSSYTAIAENGTIRLDLSGFSPGTYFISVSLPGLANQTIKVIRY